jgi:hypothetical protein
MPMILRIHFRYRCLLSIREIQSSSLGLEIGHSTSGVSCLSCLLSIVDGHSKLSHNYCVSGHYPSPVFT